MCITDNMAQKEKFIATCTGYRMNTRKLWKYKYQKKKLEITSKDKSCIYKIGYFLKCFYKDVTHTINSIAYIILKARKRTGII